MSTVLEKRTSKLTQMNTRLDHDLKKSGDEALARAGYTPSQAVRMLWAFAAMNSADPAYLKKTLKSLASQEEATAKEERAQKLNLLHKGWRLYDSFLEEIGMTAEEAKAVPLPSDEQLLEDELWEKYGEGIS